MTDFLRGLAARSLGVAAVARPRPTSRFEHGDIAPFATEVHEERAAAGSGRPEPDDAPARRVAADRPADEPAPPVRRLPAPASTPPPPSPEPPIPAARRRPPADASAAVTVAVNTHVDPHPEPAPRAVPPPDERHPAPALVVRERAVERVPATVAERPAGTALTAPVDPPPPAPEVSPVVVETTVRPVSPPPDGSRRHDSPPAAAPHEPALDPPSPAPTVTVTIGRVEVRAVAPPHPPRGDAPPRPTVMSLDEYLSRRAEGTA